MEGPGVARALKLGVFPPCTPCWPCARPALRDKNASVPDPRQAALGSESEQRARLTPIDIRAADMRLRKNVRTS